MDPVGTVGPTEDSVMEDAEQDNKDEGHEKDVDMEKEQSQAGQSRSGRKRTSEERDISDLEDYGELKEKIQKKGNEGSAPISSSETVTTLAIPRAEGGGCCGVNWHGNLDGRR